MTGAIIEFSVTALTNILAVIYTCAVINALIVVMSILGYLDIMAISVTLALGLIFASHEV